ncbi:MAG: hypothetical protein NT166_28995 [Candidatus Aminicenantes bacterium]|nr:hypothetical protein [Candidatus Aminicenantes bacterium]
METKKLKFDILGNAKDSLSQAVSHLIEKKALDESSHKRVILNLAHAVELFLKERLYRIHPAFIWKDIDRYPSNTAITINTDGALNRLRKLGGVKISEKMEKTIAALRKARNSIEHYIFEIEEKESKAIIGGTLAFIFDFTENHLGINLISEFKNDNQWAPLLKLHFEFKQELAQIMEGRLKNKPARYCPNCGELTFDIQQLGCILCGHTEGEVECDICHRTVWESEAQGIEIFGEDDKGRDISAGIAICNECGGSPEPDFDPYEF